MRDDILFDLFWASVMSKSQKLQIEPPQLSRKRKVPAKLRIGNSNPELIVCVKDWYRHQCYEAANSVINCLKARFDEPGYQLYRQSESLLLNAANGESFEKDMRKVTDFYQDDFSPEFLRSRLECLNTSFKQNKEGECRVEMKWSSNMSKVIHQLREHFTLKSRNS